MGTRIQIEFDEDLTPFQAGAVSIALKKMLTKPHFDVTELRSLLSVVGREYLTAGKDFEALRALHCVNWQDMPQALRDEARRMCLEMVGSNLQVIETKKGPEVVDPAATKPTILQRLGFG